MSSMESNNLIGRIAKFSLHRRVTMAMILLTILAVGLISVNRLPVEMNPSGMESNDMSVSVDWNVGVPIETMEKIGIPLEEELSTVRGIKSIRTSGYKTSARIRLEFKQDVDMDIAYREVRDRVERARARFPEGTEKPRIYKRESGAEPVVGFRISYDEDSEYYDLIQKYVLAPIQRIMGVADVDLWIRQREVKIEVDKDRAEAYGININQLGNQLRSNNLTVASGSVIDGGKKYTLKSTSEFKTMSEIAEIPVSDRVFLKDIATVSYEPEEADRLYRYNSMPASGIFVKKEGDANTVQVSEEVVQAIEEIKNNPSLDGFDLSVFMNQGEEIRERLGHLIDNGKMGAWLAAVVLFFFLRQFRMTLVIAMAIPLCLLIALTTMFFAGQTLNSITIMGLVICVGLLVDNSVVVAENIYRHHQDGLSRMDACVKGVTEIGFAITIATLTTLIVFCSALLIEGEMRFAVQSMSLPVITSIIASLGAALMFIPLCVYLTLSKKHKPSSNDSFKFNAAISQFLFRIYLATFEKINTAYNQSLKFFLRRRLDLSVLLILLLTGTWYMSGTLNTKDRQEEFISYFSIHVKFPEKYSMDQRLAYFKKVEALAEKNKDVYGLKAHEVHYARWYARFAGFFDVDRKSDLTREEAIQKLYEDFPEEPGVQVLMDGQRGEDSEKNRFMHHVRLVGDDPELLKQVAEQLKPTFELIPGVVSFLDEGSENDGPNEVALLVDREKASSLGVNPQSLAGAVGAAVRGQTLPRFSSQGRQIPVKLEFQEEDRSEINDIGNIQVPTDDGRISTVGAVTRTTYLSAASMAIDRRNKKVSQWFGMKLDTDMEPSQTKRAIEELKQSINLPEGVSFDEIQTSFGDEERKNGSIMILLSVVFVYMLMAFFFESTLIPLSIILTIPLAAMGSILALKVTHTFIDEMVFTGAMLLVGIVVNNGIVLVDYANRLRREGLDRSEALLTATRRRFRPIIMTALTTICGMIPLTFGTSMDMGVNFRSFGLVLIGGMTSATLFTLLAVPIFYTLIEDAQEGLSNILASVFDRTPEPKDIVLNPNSKG